MTIRPGGKPSTLDDRKITGRGVALLYGMAVVLALLGCDGPGSHDGGTQDTTDNRGQTSMTLAFPTDTDLSGISTLAVTVTRPEISFPPAPESTCIAARDVAVGHLNDDKIPDLATVGNHGNDTYVAILFGQDGGRFQDPRCPPEEGEPFSPIELNRENINGDSKNPNSGAITIGHFNNDQVVDLATMNPKTRNVSVLLGQGNGDFKEQRNDAGMPIRFPVNGFQEAMARCNFNQDDRCDFNQDGWPDLAIARSNRATVMIGKGDGSFEGQGFDLCFAGSTSIVVGLFNNDDCPDLAVVSKSSVVNADSKDAQCLEDNHSSQDGVGRVSFWLQQCTAADPSDDCSKDCPMTQCSCTAEFRIGPSVKVGKEPRFAATGDVNNDGWDDVVVANTGLHNVSILLQNSDGSFAELMSNGNPETPIRPLVGRAPIAVTLADLNVDGWLDIVTANRSSADASVLFGRPGGLFRAEERFALGGQPDALTVADLNADRLPDIIATSREFDNASVVLSTTFRKNIPFNSEMNEPKQVTINGRAVLALSINLDVPEGTDRVFTVQAFPETGVIPMFIGRQDNIEIKPEGSTPVVIDLQSVERSIAVEVRPLNTPDIFEEVNGTVVIPNQAFPVRFRATGTFMSEDLSVETDLTEDVDWSATHPELVQISNDEGEQGNMTLVENENGDPILCDKDDRNDRFTITATVKETGFQRGIPIRIDCSP